MWSSILVGQHFLTHNGLWLIGDRERVRIFGMRGPSKLPDFKLADQPTDSSRVTTKVSLIRYDNSGWNTNEIHPLITRI